MRWDDDDLHSGAMPLWAQIADRLRDAIDRGDFVEGSNLPSETEIVGRFGVSRATARNALNKLANEGLVERRSGKGTRVLPSHVEQPLNLLTSFSEDMHSRGFAPGYKSISTSIEPLDDTIADHLEVPPGTEAIRVERLLLIDDGVLAHSTSWLSPVFVPPENMPDVRSIASTPLYDWLEGTRSIRIRQGTEIIEARVAGRALASQLNIPRGSAVLNARRTARDEDGRPVEYVERQYRADRYAYRAELVRP